MICCFPVVTVAGLSVESYVVSCSVEHDYSFLGASLQPQFQKDGTLKFITPEKNLRKYTVFIQTKVILNLMATIYNLKKSWDKYNKKDVYRGNSKLSGDCQLPNSSIIYFSSLPAFLLFKNLTCCILLCIWKKVGLCKSLQLLCF